VQLHRAILDSAGLFQEAVITILAVVAKQEHIRRSDPTRAGLAMAMRQGKTLGRPELVVRHDKIAEMAATGKTTRQIGEQLGISARRVCRMLA
jgi:DNA invertase Pin-like site-specific DNA recombinase